MDSVVAPIEEPEERPKPNIIKKIFAFPIWFIRDTWKDIKFIGYAAKQIKNKEKVLDPVKVQAFKEVMKGLTPMVLIKQYWPFILAALFAGVCGWFIGAGMIQKQCNEYIYDTYLVPKLSNFTPQFIT